MNDLVRKEMTNLKELIQLRLLCIVLTFALLVLIPLPAYAVTEDVEVSVNIQDIVYIEYEPEDVNKPDVVFIITLDDMIEGSVAIVNHGEIKWWSNTPNWKVTVHRDPWTGGPSGFGWYLQVKWGPPDNSKYKTVPVWPPLDWYRSWIDIELPADRVGTGTIPGIDWRIKELLWKWSPPGSYWTTVYFTIEAV